MHRVRTVLVVVGSALVAPCVGAVPTVAQGPQPASAQKAPPATTVASSSELPPLQPGYWEFERTVFTTAQSTPQHTSIKKCSDPNLEIKQKLSDLQRKG